ncbi:MAG TPA: hypothetical protein PKE45_21920 [Caldilineaceae bacterium]|nr:hypothetical protein [Caldilineaceae bacterium]
MAKVIVYIETDESETDRWTLGEHTTLLAALQQVEALLVLLANPWWGNPDLEAIRAGIETQRQTRPINEQTILVSAD